MLAGTCLGQAAGRRVTFTVVAALGVVGFLGVARPVPETGRPARARLRDGSAAFRNVQVRLAMAMTVLGYGGVFAAITCITPMMTEVAGYSAGAVTRLLVLFGVGMFLGNLLGGRFADRALMPMPFTAVGALSPALLLFTATAHDLGRALAAWLGGVVIAAGLGCTAPDWVGALLSGAALLLSVLAAFLDRRTRSAGRIVAASPQAGTVPTATAHP